ncbi:flagellar FlbD family protein [Heliorestis acidaminivorans]|uniref:Flagellar FlbD family protein n=1 Tax=Heliorestis acidaminivorans TaxID=553427 RepID=A0A6I0F5A3_9FIRM|nr:flagellar FlbD family protein [Heliorestis acidaminivorans]
MIKVTQLNQREIVINADLIEIVESTPDTLISLTTGRKLVVKEKVEDVIERVITYRKAYYQRKYSNDPL